MHRPGSMRTRLVKVAHHVRIIPPFALGIILAINTSSTHSAGQDAADDEGGHTSQASDTTEQVKQLSSDRAPITTDDINLLQRRLNAQGYTAGAPDGDFGPQSQQALLASLRDMPDTLVALGPDFVYRHLTQNGHLQELQTILDQNTANYKTYLQALYDQRGDFSTRHMQYHLKYFARFYHGAIDGRAGEETERAINQLEAHVAPPQLSDFDDHNLRRAEPAHDEIVRALDNGNIEWLRWHMEIDEPLHLGRPVDDHYPFSGPYLDPERNRHHAGVDYATPAGTPLYAHAPARVVFAGDSWGYGNTVILEHGAGTYTLWAHLSEIDTNPGAYLQPGDLLGEAGSTGRSTGPHLHYEELVYNGRQAIEIDPIKFDDHDLTDGQIRTFAIEDAKNGARKHGFFGDAAISAAFTMRARGTPSPHLDQDPANRADLHDGFDVRTAQAVVAFLDDNPQVLADVDVDALYKLGQTPAGERLAAMMRGNETINNRILSAVENGAHQRAQKLLAASDHYTGAIDGLFGPRSKEALRAYRQDHQERPDLSHNGAGNIHRVQKLG